MAIAEPVRRIAPDNNCGIFIDSLKAKYDIARTVKGCAKRINEGIVAPILFIAA